MKNQNIKKSIDLEIIFEANEITKKLIIKRYFIMFLLNFSQNHFMLLLDIMAQANPLYLISVQGMIKDILGQYYLKIMI